MRLLTGSFAALAILAGCNEQQGLPPDSASLPASVAAAQRAPFDMAGAVKQATAACVASETQGAAALQSLRAQGFSAVKSGSGVAYAKQAPRTGVLAPDAIQVSDKNDRLACTIEVPSRDGYTYFSQVANALTALGFVKVAERGSSYRYAKGDTRLMLSGSSSTYSFFSRIELRKMSADNDITCRDSSLPSSARQGC